MNIAKLDLSSSVYKALRRAEIDTVEELMEMNELQIGKIRGIGPKALREIRDKIGTAAKAEDILQPLSSRNLFLEGAEDMRVKMVLALQQAERRVKGIQRTAYEEARRLVEELEMPSLPVVGYSEGYRFFTGTMLILHPDPDTPPEKISGHWLYKPETGCWYCGEISYPANICEIKEGL